MSQLEPATAAAAAGTAEVIETPLTITKAEERISVASNAQLVWWRFKKHRLALICGVLLILFYIVVLFPGFFASFPAELSDARLAYIPPQKPVLVHEGRVGLWVQSVVGKRNPTTLKMEWQIDEGKVTPIKFFGKGFSYKILGLIPSDIHLLAPVDAKQASRFYLLGTDRLGRDQWSRIVFGTQTSMTIGMIAVILSVILGVVLGGVSGYFGGAADMVIQRLIELLQSLPTIPIWLALTAALPRDWRPEQVFFAITVILSLLGWTTLGREVRGKFLSLREEDFVLAADLSGCSRWRIITRHMIPTISSHIIATSTLAIPVMIVNETSLSFLGLGLRPPAISWGVLLQEAQNIQTVALAPWLLIPGIVVVFAVLAFNLVGDGLRDAADPYSR